MPDTDLLVIGAGPYGYAAAAHARARGIRTRIVGRPMSFWREQMPADMYLRSGRDWTLDADGRAHASRRTSRSAGSTPDRARPDPDRGVPRPHRVVPRAEEARRRGGAGRRR